MSSWGWESPGYYVFSRTELSEVVFSPRVFVNCSVAECDPGRVVGSLSGPCTANVRRRVRLGLPLSTCRWWHTYVLLVDRFCVLYLCVTRVLEGPDLPCTSCMTVPILLELY